MLNRIFDESIEQERKKKARTHEHLRKENAWKSFES